MPNPIITAALTGPMATKADNPALPGSPAEVAESARGAFEAGAAVVHIHLRDDQGRRTADLDIARRTVELVREACPAIIQLSTGVGLEFEYEDRMKIVEVRPAMATLNPCTMTFGQGEFRNPPVQMMQLAERMLELGVKPELEVYDTGHLVVALELLKKGLLAEPLQISFVMGVRGGMTGDPALLAYLVRELPPGHELAGHRRGQGQPADDHHRARHGRQRAHRYGGHAAPRAGRAGGTRTPSSSSSSSAWHAPSDASRPPWPRWSSDCSLSPTWWGSPDGTSEDCRSTARMQSRGPHGGRDDRRRCLTGPRPTVSCPYRGCDCPYSGKIIALGERRRVWIRSGGGHRWVLRPG